MIQLVNYQQWKKNTVGKSVGKLIKGTLNLKYKKDHQRKIEFWVGWFVEDLQYVPVYCEVEVHYIEKILVETIYARFIHQKFRGSSFPDYIKFGFGPKN